MVDGLTEARARLGAQLLRAGVFGLGYGSAVEGKGEAEGSSGGCWAKGVGLTGRGGRGQ